MQFKTFQILLSIHLNVSDILNISLSYVISYDAEIVL